ncbi:MAG TPA: methyltransferase regulatory domain-containing protein, partial [Noviherbaspirillum sp.]|nr:methyltransferase regulatory domain-containing protein [Noviherbaspirillum sp.]
LVHEYMNHGWGPLYFADVAQEFAAAKLDFVGSADLVLAFPERYFTSEQQALLESVPDAVLRETVKDYLRNTGFRKDVFVRGARRMSPARQAQWLEQIGLALTTARSKVTLELDLGIGTLEVSEELYGPVIDALAERPHTLKELASLPTLQHESMAAIGEIAALLTGSGQAAPFFVSYRDADAGPAQRMNQTVVQRFHLDNFRPLASPLLGTAIDVPVGQRLVYRALTSGVDASQADAVNAQAWQTMIEEGPTIRGADNTPLDSEEAQRTALATLVNSVLTTRMPVWRQLKLL